MNRYSEETKIQILNEVKEVGSVMAVARKHGISDKTVFGWVRASRNKDVNDANKNVRQLEKIIAERDKQILVLKSLLKKTYQVWDSEDEPSKSL